MCVFRQASRKRCDHYRKRSNIKILLQSCLERMPRQWISVCDEIFEEFKLVYNYEQVKKSRNTTIRPIQSLSLEHK